ncbi:MAG: hypothetical protein BGP11_00075 [Rhodobacterales bacterium 65-51]|uniref:hypothetical protein n=1 Tax=uncultured Gemmobacter sp. TaxID=1095917 RepID=UPI000960EB1A|nr:hypothetical protein [uncultured Gemmobacter sp.]OJY35110.1 MAG: hypothetical protein BGP11_00075 [Rhodobacterales bacterium 65-51]
MISGDAYPRGDTLEEIRHRPAAGLQEIPDPVVHVLQDIGQLLLLDANRARPGRPALQRLGRRIGDLRELPDLRRALGCRADDQPKRSRGSCCGGPERQARPARKGGQPGVGQFHLARKAAKAAGPDFADAFQLGAHAPSALRHEADGDLLFSHSIRLGIESSPNLNR